MTKETKSNPYSQAHTGLLSEALTKKNGKQNTEVVAGIILKFLTK